MRKRKLMLSIFSALILSSSMYGSTASAATGEAMFSDLPAGHWAYQAVTSLARDGIVTGYGNGTFDGQQIVTRYQMAHLVASAMAHEAQASPTEKHTIEELSAEFKDEIKAMTALQKRVDKLEKKTSDTFKISGHFQQSVERTYHKGPDSTVNYWWAKELYINPEASFPKWGLTFHSQFVTKMGSSDHNGFNSEEKISSQWNGGTTRDDTCRPDLYWFEGNLGKTGQYIKFGDLAPWVQAGYVYATNLKGISLDHYGNGYATHFFAGRPDCTNGDLAVGVGPSYNNATSSWNSTASQQWSDNVRAHENFSVVSNASTNWSPRLARNGVALSEAEQASVIANGGTGSDNAYTDVSNVWSSGKSTHKTVYAFAVDRTFNKRLNGSLGYYHYTSAAYNHKPLHIGAVTMNYNLVRNLNLQGIYAQGSQHGPNSHNQGWMIDLHFRGNPWIPNDRAHFFGAHIGYHYLAPDSYIKCGYGDGIEKGQKGIEAGIYYNFTSNIQYTLTYGRGHSITNNHVPREKLYNSIAVFF